MPERVAVLIVLTGDLAAGPQPVELLRAVSPVGRGRAQGFRTASPG
jgi:hypothetical protein